MSKLAIYDEGGALQQQFSSHDEIAALLSPHGVRFERWEASGYVADDASQEEVLEAYADSVKRLKDEYGFQSVDVVSIGPNHPQREQMRAKFLDEHTHSDFEVRFFVDGAGLFYLHVGDRVLLVLCEEGDLISVPAGVAHWFDMGERPNFKCIRMFVIPEGWVAEATGSGIAAKLPTFDAFVTA